MTWGGPRDLPPKPPPAPPPPPEPSKPFVTPPDALPPTNSFRIPDETLEKGQKGKAFNGGVIPYKGKHLLAYRTDWIDTQAWVCEVSRDGFVPQTRPVRLALQGNARSAAGNDDPRLFVFRDRLHVSFTARQDDPRTPNITHVGYARLRDDYSVEQVYYPEYKARRFPHEKNWQFFEHGGELYCVYAIRPHHVVLKIDGERVVKVYPAAHATPWSGGLSHGGAAPVRVGGEYWHWFHGVVKPGKPVGAVYSVGVYSFEAKPPFRVTRSSPRPLLWCPEEGRPAGQDYRVVFPTAAFLEGDRWTVTGGVHDSWLQAWEWDAGGVARVMVPEPAIVQATHQSDCGPCGKSGQPIRVRRSDGR
jgi:predicted GH43/DUF377 family glycosyl hydrolase